MIRYGWMALSLSLLVPFDQAALRPDPPNVCSSCDEWNQPREPFRVFGNTYYVGTDGLSAMLITSDQGHILLDGGLAQSAPLIAANIHKLGFKIEDVKFITNSHAHYDHAAGIAALQRASGATVVASASGAQALASGSATPDDPQAGFGRDANAFPAVKNVRVVTDGEVVRVGPIAIEMHDTAGHTPGSTTWTWQSCESSAPSLKPFEMPEHRLRRQPHAGGRARVSLHRRCEDPEPRRQVPREHRHRRRPAVRHRDYDTPECDESGRQAETEGSETRGRPADRSAGLPQVGGDCCQAARRAGG